MPVSVSKLVIFRGNKTVRELILKDDSISIGRSPDNVVVLNEPVISRFHALVSKKAEGYVITDLESSDGTYLNDKKLSPSNSEILTDGDLIKVGNFRLIFYTKVIESLPETASANSFSEDASTKRKTYHDTITSEKLSLQGRNTISIGRDPQNDISIDHPVISRFHARIERETGSFYIADLDSINGTFVNGKQIKDKRVLMVGDNIRIGPCRLTLNIDETLIREDEEGNLRLDAVNLNKVVGKGVNLLNNISISIPARKFSVIAGVSGAGKSTLLDALNGFRPATSGSVLVNGTDLYQNFDSYRTEIGYVPQKDIVHMELTVEQALDYAAQLRMPADISPTERRKRVDEVLQDLGLIHRRDVQVKTLSGGQIKRVSIGVELLTKPDLFFLDEATSGLDPGTEADLMQLLRKLADRGRTILLITHATENVMLCDLVVFLAKGGHLAYFGPPKEALAYFGVSRFNEIYPKVENEKSPQKWQEQYLRSPQYEEFVAQQQKNLNLEPQPQKTLINFKPGKKPKTKTQKLGTPKVKRVSSWRQFIILSQRNLAIIMRDRASLILMLAIAPILGILDLLTWQNKLFDNTEGDAGQALTMLFTASLIAVMVGSLATMREIVKEQEIYRRERTIGLQVIPYVLSKIWVSIVLALYQAAIFLLFKLPLDFPHSAEILGKIYITLLLATIAGMVMGLLVSAISPNQNIAPLLTIIFLVPQITFGGGILPVHTFGPAGKILNEISLTKWSFESLVTITDLGKDVAGDRCWNLPEDKRKSLTDAQKNDCQCLGKKIFQVCHFPGIRSKYTPIVDQPEPQKPAQPEDPPKLPSKPKTNSPVAQRQYQKDLENYQTTIESYIDKIDKYQDQLQDWQDKYTHWKEKYESAIGEAEGILARFHKNNGFMFNVNVTRHWTILSILISSMFALIIWIQKRKDII